MNLATQQFTNGGASKSVRDWCDYYRISYHTVRSRYARGARSFEELFRVNTIQVRRLESMLSKQGEDILRSVDLLELILDESIRGKVLALAKANSVGGEYSVRQTLFDLVRYGFIYMEKYLEQQEQLEHEYAQWRDGKELNNKTGWTLSDAHTDEPVQTNNNFRKLSIEEELDEIDNLFK